MNTIEQAVREMKSRCPNKDFYKDLPGMVCVMLDDTIIPRYKNEPWFEKAWEEYRQHVMCSNMDEMKMPGFVFKKYVDPESINNHK